MVGKVLDFGLAKIGREQIDDRESAEPKAAYRTDVRMGTVPYMSPEKVRGDDLERSKRIHLASYL